MDIIESLKNGSVSTKNPNMTLTQKDIMERLLEEHPNILDKYSYNPNFRLIQHKRTDFIIEMYLHDKEGENYVEAYIHTGPLNYNGSLESPESIIDRIKNLIVAR